MHSCPDGSDMHNHILSTLPGSPGYATQLELLEVWPGPNFAQSPPAMPIESEAALFEARDKGAVVIFSDEVALHAVVTGPAK